MNFWIPVIAFTFSLVACGNIANGQTLKLVAERKVADIPFDNARQVRFKLAKGKTIGSYLAVLLQNEIDAILAKHGVNPDSMAVIIQAVATSGSKYYTYSDFDKDISMLPPYLISQEKVAAKLYDTVYYQDKGDNDSPDMDMESLNRQVFGTTIINVQLQFGKLDAALQKKIFSNQAVIFPVDKSPDRWLGNVRSIRVFVVE